MTNVNTSERLQKCPGREKAKRLQTKRLHISLSTFQKDFTLNRLHLNRRQLKASTIISSTVQNIYKMVRMETAIVYKQNVYKSKRLQVKV